MSAPKLTHFKGKTAVITGAGSGFGLEVARIAAQRGMNLVLVDVQAQALAKAQAELQAALQAHGAQVLAQQVDVANADAMQALADAVLARFGAPHLVFNNAGVGFPGLAWENTVADWQWVLGVNLWGVVHGVRLFVPHMLAAAQADPQWRGHVVNTASMAGLLTPPMSSIYNVTKHAVVAYTETLFHDLNLVTDQIGASVLCPYFVPTGIARSALQHVAGGQALSVAQQIAQANSERAVNSGKVSAAEVAARVFAAVEQGDFYIWSHPKALGNVAQRMQAIVDSRDPPDPFGSRPDMAQALREQLRAARNDPAT
jgi:NAD(P)-dependent dehydrogenase (short-subunit alcohol dehydrogenase family)